MKKIIKEKALSAIRCVGDISYKAYVIMCIILPVAVYSFMRWKYEED